MIMLCGLISLFLSNLRPLLCSLVPKKNRNHIAKTSKKQGVPEIRASLVFLIKVTAFENRWHLNKGSQVNAPCNICDICYCQNIFCCNLFFKKNSGSKSGWITQANHISSRKIREMTRGLFSFRQSSKNSVSSFALPRPIPVG